MQRAQQLPSLMQASLMQGMMQGEQHHAYARAWGAPGDGDFQSTHSKLASLSLLPLVAPAPHATNANMCTLIRTPIGSCSTSNHVLPPCSADALQPC